jgi:hypothetical protein
MDNVQKCNICIPAMWVKQHGKWWADQEWSRVEFDRGRKEEAQRMIQNFFHLQYSQKLLENTMFQKLDLFPSYSAGSIRQS